MNEPRHRQFFAALWTGFAAPVALYSTAIYPYFSAAYSVPRSFAQAGGHLSDALARVRDESGSGSAAKR